MESVAAAVRSASRKRKKDSKDTDIQWTGLDDLLAAVAELSR
jgi:hypothetical protein